MAYFHYKETPSGLYEIRGLCDCALAWEWSEMRAFWLVFDLNMRIWDFQRSKKLELVAAA